MKIRRPSNVPWSELFADSISKGENGIVVDKAFGSAIAGNRDAILAEESLKKLLWNRRTRDLYQEGEVLRNPKLSSTLRLLAKGSYRDFYDRGGTVAGKLINDLHIGDGKANVEKQKSANIFKLDLQNLHYMVEAFKFALNKRMLLGDDSFVDVRKVEQEMTSRRYAEKTMKRIHPDGVLGHNEYGEGQVRAVDHGTSLLAIVTRRGDALVVTSSLHS
uniref:Uncharacterized protein n=2 Tax=Ixodes scapularis TaxID=6945 RepID=A0A1S4L446_IXOSC